MARRAAARAAACRRRATRRRVPLSAGCSVCAGPAPRPAAVTPHDWRAPSERDISSPRAARAGRAALVAAAPPAIARSRRAGDSPSSGSCRTDGPAPGARGRSAAPAREAASLARRHRHLPRRASTARVPAHRLRPAPTSWRSPCQPAGASAPARACSRQPPPGTPPRRRPPRSAPAGPTAPAKQAAASRAPVRAVAAFRSAGPAGGTRDPWPGDPRCPPRAPFTLPWPGTPFTRTERELRQFHQSNRPVDKATAFSPLSTELCQIDQENQRL